MLRRAVSFFTPKNATAFFLCLMLACGHGPGKQVTPSFYYWRSVFRLSPVERQALSRLSVRTLYVKLFDVQWDEASGAPQPVARIRFSEPPPPGVSIVPVVFITNETLARTQPADADSLAARIAALAGTLTTNLPPAGELQIDCDWTAGTRDRYFRMLKALRSQPFLRGKRLSVTIRLHQMKYRSVSGVPPADRGLLMCYNMGNLREASVKNSIIDADELEKYTRGLGGYPLPLDVALPLFDWYVWFHDDRYKGLIHSWRLPSFNKENMRFESDTVMNNYRFEKGDWLRYEGSPAAEVKRVADLINRRLPPKDLRVILYHLDETSLNNYSTDELEALYRSFH